MPVEIIEASDPITAMVQFRTSAVYEMIVSLHTVLVARRHTEWGAAVRAALGSDFLAELNAIYGPEKQGTTLFEIAVDYPDHQDVPGFIDYVRKMEPVSFAFYLIGRILSREQLIQFQLDPDLIIEGISSFYREHISVSSTRQILADIPTFQRCLVNLWQRYWDTYFYSMVPPLLPHWTQAITDKQRMLARNGGRGLLEAVTGKTELFGPLPEGQPVTEIVFIPLFYVSAQCYMFFGYGNETVLFDSERTDARISELNQGKEWALNVTKALADSTRLNILRLIAECDGGIHGKQIAARLKLSPSTVSRQLTQLRDSGLIAEDHHDNQTVTYRLIEETITDLPAKILDYLHT